jgi:hypothetical protein
MLFKSKIDRLAHKHQRLVALRENKLRAMRERNSRRENKSQEYLNAATKDYEDTQRKVINIDHKIDKVIRDMGSEKIYVENPHIQYLLDMRQEKIYELGNDTSYLENDALVKIIFEIINKASSADSFKTQLNSKMEEVNKTLSTDYSQQIIDFVYNKYGEVVKFEDQSKRVIEPVEKD